MKIIITNSYAHVQGTKHAQFLVHHALKYTPPGSKFAQRRAKGKYDGSKSMHDRRACRFPSGLLPIVLQYLGSIGCSYELADLRRAPSRPSYPVALEGITLRDYQEQSVAKFLNASRGVLKLATGAGKTEVAVAITKAISRPTIFLTHRVNLLYQSAERFIKRWPECKKSIGIIGDGNFQFAPITFATVQTLHSAIKKHGKAIESDLAAFNLMIVDEAHRVGATQFHECAGALPNAFWRLGLTATPFMSENPGDNLHLLGALGSIVHEVSATTLIERGVLARPFFKFHQIVDHTLGQDISKLTNWRDIYEQGIINNSHRNQIIAQNTAGLVRQGYKPLVIIKEIEHGNILQNLISQLGIKCETVTGADDYSVRGKILKNISSGKIQAIICSNIFDEGVDVQDISAVVLAAGTKSAPALFQRTGRAIRKKEDGGNAIIIDFIDTQNRILKDHSLRRFNLVKSEPGFKIF